MAGELVDPKREEKQAKAATKAAAEEVKSASPPIGYIPVRFASEGKLSSPEVLHFRNYHMEEAAELARVRDDQFDRAMVKILNRLVWEDFDCRNLHEEEVVEVMLSLYANFWSPQMEGFPYMLDPDLPEGDRYEAANRGRAKLNLTELDSVSLPEKFKEPIVVKTKEGAEYHFNLLRIGDRLDVQDSVDEEYRKREEPYKRVRLQLLNNPRMKAEDVKNPQEFIDYLALLEEKDITYRSYLRYAQLCGYRSNGEYTDLNSLAEKKEIGAQIDLTIWASFIKAQENLDFGIQRDIEFYSQELGETITRRFYFRGADFVPNMDVENDSGNVVSFGV